MSGKRKCFSVEQKMQIIRRLEAGERNVTLAREFCICPSTIVSIQKNTEKIKALFNSNALKTKRARAPNHEQVDKALLQWVTIQRSRGTPLSGPLLQEKANFIAKQFKIENFNCSASWISRFKVRHNIVAGTRSGESLMFDVSKWLRKVWPTLRKDFNDDEIFTADETALFYKLTPNESINFKGEKCTGGELSKERITVLVAANLRGNRKKKLLVIGKSKRPRCFKQAKSLPVSYYSNHRAWMTSEIFIHWLRNWNAELKKKKKKILLLVDNCPAHPTISALSNITLGFLPPNMTSILQPMGQGIIRTLKSIFRKNLLLKIVSHMEENSEENYPKITILDAILMVNDAWEKLSPATIANCFKHSGFTREKLNPISSSSSDSEDDDEDDIPLSIWARDLKNQLPISEKELDEYVLIDNDVAICEEHFEDNIVKKELHVEQFSDADESEDMFEPTDLEAFKAAEILSKYVHLKYDDESLMRSISRLSNAVRDSFYKSQATAKQSKMTDYLSSE